MVYHVQQYFLWLPDTKNLQQILWGNWLLNLFFSVRVIYISFLKALNRRNYTLRTQNAQRFSISGFWFGFDTAVWLFVKQIVAFTYLWSSAYMNVNFILTHIYTKINMQGY
jgi:hypothetical protein